MSMTRVHQAIGSFLAVTAGQASVAFSWIRIEAQSPNRLVLNANSRLIAADGIARMISAHGRSIASFDAIDSIGIRRFTNGKRREWWVVSLCLVGQRTVRIGRTMDDVQASLAAAALSTVTGKRVRVLQGWGL